MKRGILLIVILLLSISVLAIQSQYKTSISLNLSNHKVSPGQNLDGFINISFKEPISSDSKLKFFINSKDYNSSFPVTWLLRNIRDKNIIQEKYEKTGNNIPSKEITFNSKGSKIEAGVDFSSTSLNNIGEISEFSITFTGSPIDSSYPTLKVDIGNDKIIDYQYQGNILQNQFDHISSEYVSDDTVDQIKGIRSQQQDTYCQKVFINKPSKSYKISGKVRKLSAGTNLRASLSLNPTITDCVTEKCCTLNPGSNLNNVGCTLDIEINDPDDYYACISAFDGDDLDNIYYEIAADNDPKYLSGYYNGNPSTVDYFIFVDAQKYDNKLTSSKKYDFDPAILNNYLANCNDCLLVPINISSDSKGKITLSNLNVKYVDAVSGPTQSSSFAQLSYTPESINYSKSLVINLNDFDLIAPVSTAENNKIYAQVVIGNVLISSNELSFDVLEGPKAFISYDTNTPGVNEFVNFNANKSRKIRNNNLKEFRWDFGDGNISNDLVVGHSYFSKGNYTVTLTVTDEQGLVGKDKVIIFVQESSNTLQQDVDETFSIIKSSKDYLFGLSSQAKDTASILDLTNKLSSLESNLTSKNNSIQNIVKGSQSLQEKESKLNEIRQQVLQIKSSIPIKLGVSIATFNPKVNSLDDIPSDIEGSSKEIFKAQNSISVDGEARNVIINYYDHVDNFILVRKKVKSGSGDIYEVVPSSAELGKIITPGSVKVSDNVLKFTQSEYYYLLNGDVNDALNTKTIIVPSDIPEENDGGKEVEENIKISTDISWYWIIIPTLVLILLIIYFGLFFKGGLLNKNRKLFKSDKDYQTLFYFVKNALNKGVKEEKVIEVLKKKNWTDQQISMVFADLHKSKKK